MPHVPGDEQVRGLLAPAAGHPNGPREIGGRRPAEAAGPTSEIRDPRTGRTIGRLPLLTQEEIPAVVARAAQGFVAWAAVPVAERGACLATMARILAGRDPGLGRVLSQETGKTVLEAETELDRAVDTLRWVADAAVRVCADHTRDETGRQIVVDPAGPVLAIVPSNFPAVVLARKIGPALAMGCSVVVKGPETAPSVVREIVAAGERAGLPHGVLAAVFATPDTAEALVRRPEFQVVSFTGSTRVGRLVAAAAADVPTQCVLELGGHAPAIVTADADLDLAARTLAAAKFGSAGQSCAAPSRFLVDERVAEDFVARFLAAAPRLDCELDAAGRPGTMGPLHTARHRDEVHELVLDALAQGARRRLGDSQVPSTGYYYPPTVLTQVPPQARLLWEEPFGPVAPIVEFHGEDEAVALANNCPYRLGAFVFGEPTRMDGLARRLDAGRVSINCVTGADPESPLAGRARSGYGYEGGNEGMLAFARLKVFHRHPG